MATKRAPSKKTAATKSASMPKKAAAKSAAAKPKSSSKQPAKPTKKATPLVRADPRQITERLTRAIPEPRCELDFRTPFELLIATILSAQSTDKTVNAVTPSLFARFPTPHALAEADQDELETLIKRTGFFRNKAKSVRAASAKLVSDFAGEVPRTIAELTTLHGVARKTANVVLGTAYGLNEGFVVDTHIARVSQRLGLTQENDPGKIEQALCALFPQPSWSDMGHRILLHGRYTCLAKAPLCSACPLNELCPSKLSEPEADWRERASSETARVLTGMAKPTLAAGLDG